MIVRIRAQNNRSAFRMIQLLFVVICIMQKTMASQFKILDADWEKIKKNYDYWTHTIGGNCLEVQFKNDVSEEAPTLTINDLAKEYTKTRLKFYLKAPKDDRGIYLFEFGECQIELNIGSPSLCYIENKRGKFIRTNYVKMDMSETQNIKKVAYLREAQPISMEDDLLQLSYEKIEELQILLKQEKEKNKELIWTAEKDKNNYEKNNTQEKLNLETRLQAIQQEENKAEFQLKEEKKKVMSIEQEKEKFETQLKEENNKVTSIKQEKEKVEASLKKEMENFGSFKQETEKTIIAYENSFKNHKTIMMIVIAVLSVGVLGLLAFVCRTQKVISDENTEVSAKDCTSVITINTKHTMAKESDSTLDSKAESKRKSSTDVYVSRSKSMKRASDSMEKEANEETNIEQEAKNGDVIDVDGLSNAQNAVKA